MTPAYGVRSQTQQTEGITVVGEAVRRVAPETVELLIEIGANSANATQALRDYNTKMTLIAQALAPLGVQRTDFETISMNLLNMYSPVMPALAGFSGMSQIGPGGISPFGGGLTVQPGAVSMQPVLQFGSYQVRSLMRVKVREPGRVGEIVDALTRASATLAGSFSFHASDEAGARRAVLEAAARDARAKAEVLAQAAGKQIGDALSVTEDVVVSNGAYAALRSAVPFTLGAGTPQISGELEYYARVSASFRFQ